MAEKLSWTELRRVLASRAGVSEKEANTFLNALYAEVVEALKTDKQVKINGLGIFKLQAVAPRKSVNVATGEAITIEGYNKVAFVPEAGVKELVEKGGVSPQPIPEGKGEDFAVVDPIKKLGSQAEEIVDILGELGQSPKEEEAPAKEPEVPEVPEVQEEPIKEPEPVPEPEPVVIPEPEPAKEPEPEPVFYVPQHTSEPAPVKKEKKHHFLRDTLICVVILLALLLVGYFFLRSQLGNLIDSFLPGKAQTEQVAATDSIKEEPISAPIELDEEVEAGEEELTEAQILAEFLEASDELENSETSGDAVYEDLITIEPMHEASRLTWMAKRFYGSKAYWPYIYDANRDHISNPSNIDVGTPIRVPRLTEAQKDTTSAAYLQLLQEAEAACKK